MMTKEQLQKVMDEANSRGYGVLSATTDGKIHHSATPLKRDKDFEARMKKLTPDIYTAMAPTLMKQREAKAAVQVPQQKKQPHEDFLKVLAGGAPQGIQWAANNPTDAAMLGASLIPGEGVPFAAKMLFQTAMGAGLGNAEGHPGKGMLQGASLEPLSWLPSKLLGAAGSIAKWSGKNATRKLAGDADSTSITDYLKELFNRPGHQGGPNDIGTVKQLENDPWWRVFRRGIGTPGNAGPLARQGQVYDATMNHLQHKMEANARQMGMRLKAMKAQWQKFMQAPVLQDQKLSAQQINQYNYGIKQMEQEVADARAEALTFREGIRQATAFRKKAFHGGLPGDMSLMKEGGPAYENAQKYEKMVEDQESVLTKRLGQHGVDIFKEAKAEFAQAAALTDLAQLPNLGEHSGIGKWIFNTHALQEGLDTNAPSLSRRLGDNVYQELSQRARLDPFKGGDMPAGADLRGFVTTHGGMPRGGVGVTLNGGPESNLVPEFAGNPSKSWVTHMGEMVQQSAPAASKATVAAIPSVFSKLRPPEQQVDIPPELRGIQEDDSP